MSNNANIWLMCGCVSVVFVLFLYVSGNFIQYQICIRTIIEALDKVILLQNGFSLFSKRQ